MTHTPGPYYIMEYDNQFHILRKWGSGVRAENTNTFGSCYGAHIAKIDYVEGGVPSRAQADANARLIAAAPELLEALEACVLSLRTFRNVPKHDQLWVSSDDDAINAGFAAIAKAKSQ